MRNVNLLASCAEKSHILTCAHTHTHTHLSHYSLHYLYLQHKYIYIVLLPHYSLLLLLRVCHAHTPQHVYLPQHPRYFSLFHVHPPPHWHSSILYYIRTIKITFSLLHVYMYMFFMTKFMSTLYRKHSPAHTSMRTNNKQARAYHTSLHLPCVQNRYAPQKRKITLVIKLIVMLTHPVIYIYLAHIDIYQKRSTVLYTTRLQQ